MPLTLTVRNVATLENGSPVSFVLDRRGARIGRTPTADWSLPDPTRYISSDHCEVRFAGEHYELIDKSTNGTFLLGQAVRLPVPYTIRHQDVFIIGRFEVEASLDDASAHAAAARMAAPQMPEWSGWAAGTAGADIAAETSSSGWGAPPPAAAISGGGPLSQAWAPPSVSSPAPDIAPSPGGWGEPAHPEAPASSTWGAPPPPPAVPPSDWSSPAAPPQPPGADDIWGKFAGSNVVDWSRSGFGAPPPPRVFAEPAPMAPAPPSQYGQAPMPPPQAQPFQPHPQQGQMPQGYPPQAMPPAYPQPHPQQAAPMMPAPSYAPQAAPPVQHPHPQPAPYPQHQPQTQPHQPAPGPSAGPSDGIAALLQAANMDPASVRQSDAETATIAGDLLRRLVSGLFVMLEARARAKSQMGAQGTSFSADGNNPLKFARTPDQALAALLNPPERGFQSADRAVEDAFKDLQAHQMATLRAMQGALRATLDRFSPNAIRTRAKDKGFLSKIMPGAQDAALWNAYEKEFGGVVQGSDEAFIDMFAKEFRRAYDEIANQR